MGCAVNGGSDGILFESKIWWKKLKFLLVFGSFWMFFEILVRGADNCVLLIIKFEILLEIRDDLIVLVGIY
jgi:hypothetical protein